MSNNSKAKLIADLLESDVSKWWTWDEILEGLMPGFANVPARYQADILSTYMTYIPSVLNELDERGRFLLSDGRAQMRKFKIATNSPEDRPEIDRRIVAMQKREDSYSNKRELRIGNLKDQKILPKNWSSQQKSLTG